MVDEARGRYDDVIRCWSSDDFADTTLCSWAESRDSAFKEDFAVVSSMMPCGTLTSRSDGPSWFAPSKD